MAKHSSVYKINGRVIDRVSRKPVSGFKVEAWDMDLLCDDLLGTASTNSNGAFSIEFTDNYFRELFLDRRPDLYFKVFDESTLVKSTQDSVYWNLGAGNKIVEIEIDAAPGDAPPSATERPTILATLRWSDDDTPVAGFDLRVLDRSTREQLASGTSDWTGSVYLQLLDPIQKALDVAIEVADGNGQLALTLSGLSITRGNNRIDVGVPGRARPSSADSSRPHVVLGELKLDAKALDEVRPETVLAIARALRQPEFESQVKEVALALSVDLVPSLHARKRLSNTDLLETLQQIIEHKRWPREVSLALEEILKGPLGFATEQIHDCTNFQIHYYIDGADAVDPSTAADNVLEPGGSAVLGSLPAGGAPTYVKRVCFWLERALSAYVSAPFSLRNPAASGKIPVYINSADFGSATAGAFYINKALSNDVMCAVAVHELFHMVQYEYPGSGDWLHGMREGGAVFAEDSAADLMNRYLDEAGTNFNLSGIMVTPQTSLKQPSFRYKTCTFWRYIAEQHSPRTSASDEPKIGVETYRALIETLSAGSWSDNDLRSGLRNLPWYQDFHEFGYLDAARLDLTSSETTLGNFYLALYLKDLGFNVPDRRFDFMEDEENIFIDDALRAIGVSAPNQSTLTSVARSTHTLGTSGSVAQSNSLEAFSARYHEVAIDGAVTNVQVAYTASGGLTNQIFQIVLIDENNKVRDIVRSDKTTFSKRFTNLLGGKRLSKVVLVPVAATTAGSYSLTVTPEAASSDVMVTRWHSPPGRQYEIDSRNWAWTWVSPDIWVDNGGDGVPDPEVYFDFDNQLFVRLRNRGNAVASGVGVQFWYQNAAGGLSDSGWLPVRNSGGVVQSLSGLTLAADSVSEFSVPWAPSVVAGSHHYCIRAVIAAPGDPNADDKRVLSNFGNVIVRPGGFRDFEVVRRNIAFEPRPLEVAVVPRGLQDYRIARSDLERSPVVKLAPNATQLDQVRVYHRPNRKLIVHQDAERLQHNCGAPERLPRRPDPEGDYAVDQATLPPTLQGRPLVTVVHLVEGLPVGGVTFALSAGESRRPQ